MSFRKNITKPLPIVAATLLVNSFHANAFERDHDAHVHGHAELSIVSEGSALLMELHSPAMNMVGFEHQPSTDQQKQSVEKAGETLRNASTLFTFNSEANCQLQRVTVESALFDDEAHGHDEHHKEHREHDDHKDHDERHDEHDHAKHHGEAHDEHDHHDDHNEGHGHDEHDHGDDGDTHSEFAATYQYQCQNMSKLNNLKLQLFKQFPSLEALEVQIAGDKGQQLLELNKQQTHIQF